MSLAQAMSAVEYPESDGQPVGETDFHIDWVLRLRDIFKHRYQGQQVYVAGNLLVYYVEGDPKKCVSPDGFVVKDCSSHRRRVFKVWEEGRAPNVVFEFTSLGSRREDQVVKPVIYAQLGIREYFLFDPTGEYLVPVLMGFRLEGDKYVRIAPDVGGALRCEELGILLRVTDGDLVLLDEPTGQALPTRAEAEQTGRDAALARVARLEAELERLKISLGRSPGDPEAGA